MIGFSDGRSNILSSKTTNRMCALHDYVCPAVSIVQLYVVGKTDCTKMYFFNAELLVWDYLKKKPLDSGTRFSYLFTLYFVHFEMETLAKWYLV